MLTLWDNFVIDLNAVLRWHCCVLPSGTVTLPTHLSKWWPLLQAFEGMNGWREKNVGGGQHCMWGSSFSVLQKGKIMLADKPKKMSVYFFWSTWEEMCIDCENRKEKEEDDVVASSCSEVGEGIYRWSHLGVVVRNIVQKGTEGTVAAGMCRLVCKRGRGVI